MVVESPPLVELVRLRDVRSLQPDTCIDTSPGPQNIAESSPLWLAIHACHYELEESYLREVQGFAVIWTIAPLDPWLRHVAATSRQLRKKPSYLRCKEVANDTGRNGKAEPPRLISTSLEGWAERQ